MSRTMIEKLGFQDRDKQNPNHDLACQYITQPEVQDLLRTIIAPPNQHISIRTFKFSCDWDKVIEDQLLRQEWRKREKPPKCSRKKSSYEKCLVRKEHPISKGENQYRTTIGFIDVWMTFEHHQAWVAKLHSDEPLRFVSRERYRVIVEVKTVINVGEILRQLKLYTEYVKGARLVLVSTVPVTSLEHQALSDEGVVVVVLGESFERWKTSRMSVTVSDVWEV